MWRFGRRYHRKRKRCRRCTGRQETLADVLPGEAVRLLGFAPELPPERWGHLQAYGLAPGRCVRVLQRTPITVVQVEHSEIALEDELACQICVANNSRN